MAVYCKEYKLLFIGNTRTASTSLGRALVEHCGGEYLPEARFEVGDEHITPRHATIKQLVDHELLDCDPAELYKFVSVRNPFDSLVSQYLKFRYRPNRASTIYQREAMTFEQFLEHRFEHAYPRSMHKRFVTGTDHVIFFEKLQEGVLEVLARVNAPAIQLPVVNKTMEKRAHYSAYYNVRTREMVEGIFAQDLEQFGYEFEDYSNGEKVVG
jgi:hypothetical protein